MAHWRRCLFFFEGVLEDEEGFGGFFEKSIERCPPGLFGVGGLGMFDGEVSSVLFSQNERPGMAQTQQRTSCLECAHLTLLMIVSGPRATYTVLAFAFTLLSMPRS